MKVEDMGLRTSSRRVCSAGYTPTTHLSPSKSPPLNKGYQIRVAERERFQNNPTIIKVLEKSNLPSSELVS